MKRRLFPRPLAECIDQAAKPALAKHDGVETRLLRHWETIVGPQLAGCCLPYSAAFPPGKRQGGTLTLQVAPSHALEVQHMQPQILEKLAVYFGYRAITALRLRQAPLPAKPAGNAPRTATPDMQEKLGRLAQALLSDSDVSRIAYPSRKE